MVKIQIDMDAKANKNLRKYMVAHNLPDKKTALLMVLRGTVVKK